MGHSHEPERYTAREIASGAVHVIGMVMGSKHAAGRIERMQARAQEREALQAAARKALETQRAQERLEREIARQDRSKSRKNGRK
ncbi:hypothetical protein ABT160_43555 [Streptomyces sp. NPDC001941]|uniref:hypothetical protein n=1 Tax=Streptomyces sp. NPDC001941 TaxID=3154659 RepID=UPI00331D578A